MRALHLWAGLLVLGCSASSSEDNSIPGSGGSSGSGGTVASGGTWPGTGSTSGAGGTTSGGGSGGTPLVCDSHYSFSAGPPVQVGTAFVASYADSSPYSYIDMQGPPVTSRVRRGAQAVGASSRATSCGRSGESNNGRAPRRSIHQSSSTRRPNLPAVSGPGLRGDVSRCITT